MRTYLVVIDETDESESALRFAARRAAKTGGGVQILAVVAQSEFVQWGGVQATMEEEARTHAEALVTSAAGTLVEEAGVRPSITVRTGDPVKLVREALAANPNVAALVLGVAANGGPGPLVAHFTGAEAANLPCPLMLIPGSLTREALDRLS
ncbi:MAG: universal stress protein [Sphingomonas sanxanigenens]|uniref:Universal stress protein n=1 Tax=Sphingomonas sanxanigenens TaxID=397260 RepID=A0A2W5C1U1_9SPHN|nr:MAG: universal stress protein [Sphingomonas sanxanigenens]